MENPPPNFSSSPPTLHSPTGARSPSLGVSSPSDVQDEARPVSTSSSYHPGTIEEMIRIFGREEVMELMLRKASSKAKSPPRLKDPPVSSLRPRSEQAEAAKAPDSGSKIAILPSVPQEDHSGVPLPNTPKEPDREAFIARFEEEFQAVAESAYEAGIRSAQAKVAKESPQFMDTKLFNRHLSFRDSDHDARKKSGKKKKSKKKNKPINIDGSSSSSSPSSSSSSSSENDSSSNSDSSSSSSDSENDRKGSILMPAKARRVAGSRVPKSKRNTVRMYADQPKFGHIRLEQLKLNPIFVFWSEIDKYKQMYGIELPAATLVDEKCRLAIMSKNKVKTHAQFYKLSNRTLAKFIQRTIKPTDKNMFAKQLSESLGWTRNRDDHRLSISNYQSFYDRLLSLRREFEEKYEFLAFENEAKAPKMENKPGGTIRIFLDVIPEAYAKLVFANLGRERYKSLKEFLDAFYADAKEHFKISVEASKLNSFLPSREEQSEHSRKAPEAAPSARKFFVRRPSLHNMDEPYESYMADLLDPTHEWPATTPERDFAPTEDVRSESDDREEWLDLRKPPADSKDLPPDELNAFGGLKTTHRPPPKPGVSTPSALRKPMETPKGPNGCFRALMEGKCLKPGCTFDHSVAALDATREDMQNKMAKRLYASRALNAIDQPQSTSDPPSEERA